MEKPLVTFIIPMYNEEERIQKCVGSIQNQTLKEIEIIVVNDGSTDGSQNIVQSIMDDDPRISLLNFENGGTAIALNNGLKAARGNYIGFSGADDWIEPDMAKKMLQHLESEKSDIVVCNIQKESPGKTQHTISIPSNGILTDDLLKKFIVFDFDYSICNKLYPRNLIVSNSIEFDPSLRIGQDVLFNLYIFTKVKKLSIMPQAFYHYVAKNGSLMASPPQKRVQSFNRIITEFENFCQSNHDDESWQIFSRYIGLAYQSYFFNLVLNSPYTEALTFKKYYDYLIETLQMMHPLLIPYPKWSVSKLQSFKNQLLHKKQFKLFAFLAAIRHKTIF